MRGVAAAVSAFLLVASVAFGGCGADGGTPGSLAVADAWSRPVAVDASTTSVGVVYLSLHNGTTLEQQLVGLETPVASRAEIHETRMEGDIARMRQVDSIHLLPGERVELRPGGVHGMLMGVNRELTTGDLFPLLLIFAGGDSLSTTVEVRRP